MPDIKLSEEQFEALKDWIDDVATRKARSATNQPSAMRDGWYDPERRAHEALVEEND
jgi:hypothetical protein